MHVSNIFKALTRTSISFCFLYLFSLALPVFSEEIFAEPESEKFQIEYILFLHNENRTNEKESLNSIYKHSEGRDYTRLIKGYEPLSANHYPKLDSEQLYLSEALQNLSRSKDVRVIEHGAWQQSIQSESTLPPISINTLIQTKTGKDFHQERYLQGTLTIKRSKYLHIDTNIYLSDYIYFPEGNIIDWLLPGGLSKHNLISMLTPYSGNEMIFYRTASSPISRQIHALRQTRRLKYGEIHYIDHPVIGLITTINKLELDPEI